MSTRERHRRKKCMMLRGVVHVKVSALGMRQGHWTGYYEDSRYPRIGDAIATIRLRIENGVRDDEIRAKMQGLAEQARRSSLKEIS